jgi:CheY-like chemotaxis protein
VGQGVILHVESRRADDELGLRSEVARILVVDDDRELREVLHTILTGEGHEVILAGNGLEALERLDDGCRPTLILLDLTMPVLDGWQFLAQRSMSPALSAIPVVVMTANPTPAIPEAVLRKPFPVDELLDRVGAHG